MSTPEPVPDPQYVVGRTELEQQRNAALFEGYDYSRSPSAITGYTGQDLQCIHSVCRYDEAIRTRVGGRGNYKAGMTQLADGRILLAVCREESARRDDQAKNIFQMVVYDSTDSGLTWREIARPGIIGKEPSLVVAADGAVVMTAQYADFRPDAKRDGAWVCRSTDGGYTWENNLVPGAAYPRNIIVEQDGSQLFLRPKADRQTLEVCRSTDHGRTWTFSDGTIAWAPGELSFYGEIALIRLQSGRLLACLRRALPPEKGGTLSPGQRGHGFADSILTESTDNGNSWSAPRPLTNTAEVHVHLLQLADGRLLATYVNYHQPFGVAAIVSQDDGGTWDRNCRVQLSFAAVSGTGNNGWPVSLQLPDGDLLTCFANNAYPNDERPTVVCEVVRWRLAP